MRLLANCAFLFLFAAPMLAQAPPPPAPAPSAPASQSTATPASGTTSEAAAASTAVPAEFEIADIHKSPSSNLPSFRGGFLREGRYFLRQATMADLITSAFSLKSSSYVQGGPSWLDWDRYDIIAKVPAGTTQTTARKMLQNLLADRFKLMVHPGDAQVPAFLMTAANGKPNLKPASAADGGGCQRPNQPSPERGPGPTIELLCHGASLSSLADALNTDGGGGYLSYPVIDSTGLQGVYDLDLKWTQKYFLTRIGPSAINIFQALEQQLGLKLDFKTTPRPGIVVDSVNEEPTPNPPDLAKIMPPLPLPQFEVAVIRPHDPQELHGMGRISGDEVKLDGIPLKFLITLAWDLDPRDDSTLIAPKWIDSDRIDIHARIAASDLGVNSGGKPGTMDFDDIRPMLRALLIDRFQIKYHVEDRPGNAYILTADHPRLDKADPSERTGCTDGPGRDGKDPRLSNVMLNSLITCRNVTMDQYAAMLSNFRGRGFGYQFYQVFNETGLKGAWDFTVSWSSLDLTQSMPLGPGSPAPDSAAAASDPNGAITYYEALDKQHGLKLVKTKRPEPVLVIDSISQVPTEN